MNPYETKTFEATPGQLERLVLLTLIGALDSLRKGCLAEDDARHLLIQPTAIESLKLKGLSKDSSELLLEALHLEDVRTISSERHGPMLDELKEKAFRRLEELPRLDVQAPRWFCAEADRRAKTAYRLQSEATAQDPEDEEGRVRIEYRLRGEDLRRQKTLTYEEFYDPLDGVETYLEHGVVRYLDFRDFLDVDPARIRFLRVETPEYNHTVHYGARGSLLQHTVYGDGEEMLVVQDELEPHVSHCVKLLRDAEGEWRAEDVSRLDDRTAEIVDLW